MDRFRAEVVRQQTASPEEKTKQKRAMLVPHCFRLMLYIPMVVIGCQHNGECDMPAPLYLLVGGGAGFAITLLKIIAILTPSDCDDKIANALSPVASIFSFVVTIWGSIVVFSSYSSWTYKKPGDDQIPDENLLYCPYTPFMFAFVLLILEWVLAPAVFFCECLLTCLTCCGNILTAKAEAAKTAEYTAAATTDAEEKAGNIIKQQDDEKV